MIDCEEVWEPIKGWELIAEVSNLGRIRTLPRKPEFVRKGKQFNCNLKGKIVSPYVAKNGYLTIAFMTNKVRKKVLVHRAVAHAFVDGHFEKATVNHIDGNKLNNLPSNLEWVSLADNSKHAWEIGLVNLRGENQPGHKLSIQQVKIVRRLLKSNAANPNELSVLMGVSAALIYLIQKGKRWSHITDD